jgi:bacillithiol system protein YtxJ
MWKKVRQFLTGGGYFQMSETSETQTNFAPVTDAGALDELVARSHDAPVVLFKHSTTCPISARAHHQMSKLAADNTAGQISLVVVQSAREVSRRVVEQTGIRHESPQAIILRNGQAVWSASHFDITAEAVAQAVRDNE